MFGIDFSEILLIFGIALVVLGPEKLPKLANTIGKWIGRARGMARQFREQLEQESQTLHKSVDVRAEFSSRPGAQPGNGGAVPRPTADSSTAPAGPQAPAQPQPQPRIDPRTVGPPSPTRPGAAVGSEPAVPMTGPPLPEMGLADTYPAAFHPYQPPPITEPPPAPAPTDSPAATATAAAATPSTPGAAAAAGEAAAQDDTFPAPHQTAFWPPDGRL
ncbi:MAG TPA: Sec-independent protein translocase protein TatB [Steroidobacteraceae bacterium]|jgi:sec-independent protein translocase protein TatB|nr:Sec-independent protein translocase protein TatB [Steroidobacteraceae bacterium]